MKTIKFLVAVALVSFIAISCKETKKEEVESTIEVVEEPVVLEEEVIEVAVDSTAAVVEEEIIEEVEQ
jgi:hypothetical protein